MPTLYVELSSSEHVLQPGPVAGHEHEVVPTLGELAAEGEADAGTWRR